MLTKTEAIVLHSLKYGESRLVVDLFTRTHGRLSCIVSIPKTGRGKVKKQFFQPLTLIDIACDLRPRVQLQKIRDARLLHPYTSLMLEPSKLAISLFLAEFLYHALRGDGQPDEPLFDYIASSLQWLDAADDGYANFHLAFLMHLSRFLGFRPNLESADRQQDVAAYFDLREGSFCGLPPLHQDFLRPDEAARLRTMMRMDYPTMHLFRMSRTDRNRCLDVMLTYYRLHLPAFPEMKSLAVLREFFL